jgi:hypothetical protein
MRSKLLQRIRIGVNREIRITQIDTDQARLLRIGAYLTEGKTLSGVTFPAQSLDELISALQKVRREQRAK